MKLGGKPFFCLSTLGFLWGEGAKMGDPDGIPWPRQPPQSSPSCPQPSTPSGLTQLPLPILAQQHPQHSLAGIPTVAEGEALDPAVDLQDWGGTSREHEACPALAGVGWGRQGQHVPTPWHPGGRAGSLGCPGV